MFEAVRDLLQGVVDYAGLFPPAKLPLQKVVSNFAQYAEGAEHWMLGRLILPVGDLAAAAECAARLGQPNSFDPWRISCLLPNTEPQQLRHALSAIEDFNGQHRAAPRAMLVDSVEVKAGEACAISAVANCLPVHIEAFLELPWQQGNFADLTKEIRSQGAKNLRAKIRTGGVLPELIPPIEVVAEFIKACVKHRVAFKGTAGLHHPVRSEQALTYDLAPQVSTMHGFLNVLFATAAAMDGGGDIVKMLSETRCEAFVPSDAGWLCRGREFTVDAIRELRQAGMISFGSCSFVEPVDDLQELGIGLTAGAP